MSQSLLIGWLHFAAPSLNQRIIAAHQKIQSEMDIIYLLIPVSLLAVLLISMLFWWAIKGGQFDDLEGPSFQIMMDDDRDTPKQPAQESQR